MKQSLSPNVYIRFKPHSKDTIHFNNSTSITVNGPQRKIYTFDHIFEPHSSTREVFEVSCKSHVINSIQGVYKNTLVFVYGNTGTGKTYTIGLLDKLTETSEGLIPLSLKQIFSFGCEVSLSFYEIYNEEVYDLLNSGCKPLSVRQNQKEPYLEGLLEISVDNYLEAVELINIGREQRKVAEQKMNRNSSRSHAILTLSIHHQNSTSKLCFVDLAGSERLKQSESKGVNMTEAVHINSSLSSLETVLVGLASNCPPSFRSTKLTRLLQPYFSSPISMIVTSNGANTQNIEFAKRCKNIRMNEQSQEQETLSRIKYLEEQLVKAKRSLRRESGLTPRKSLKENVGRSKLDHSVSQSKQSQSYSIEDRNELKNLQKAITKLLTVLENSYKSLEHLCSASNTVSQAYYLIDDLKIENLNVKKFVEQRLPFLKDCPKPQKLKINLKEIADSINDTEKFNKKVNQIGEGIHQLSTTLSQSKHHLEQICTRQLKCYLLEKKGKHNEEIISYLLTKVDRKQSKEVQMELKQRGVKIEVNSRRDSYIKIQEEWK